VPWALCFTLIALSAWLNVLLGLASSGQRLARDGEATAQIAFDILQLSGLLYLTGGALNPFALLLIAPVTLAAATLPARYALGLGVLAIAASVLLALFSMPLPTINGPALALYAQPADAVDHRHGPDRRHHPDRRLCLAGGQRVRADGAGPERHRDRAGPRAAAVGPGRSGRRRRPRAGHAAGHHLGRGPRNGPQRHQRETARTPSC
jgi:hypothetical protein